MKAKDIKKGMCVKMEFGNIIIDNVINHYGCVGLLHGLDIERKRGFLVVFEQDDELEVTP